MPPALAQVEVNGRLHLNYIMFICHSISFMALNG